MSASIESNCPERLPTLRELGRDLLCISPARIGLVVLTPFVCFAAYVVLAAAGWWPAAIVAVMALSFFTYGYGYIIQTFGSGGSGVAS